MKAWYSHHPGHSCKDIRDSGDSKGDREHWIDPEKSGNPLKVFCDMTTDGGKLRMVSKEYSSVILSTCANVFPNICALTSRETLPTESCLSNVVKA